MAATASARRSTASPPTPADFADHDSAAGLQMLCAADHPAAPVEWLWPGCLALGKVALLAGDPGTGKSLLALDVAARVTRGLAFPGELQRQGDQEQGRQGDTPSTPSASLSPCLQVSLPGPPRECASDMQNSEAGSVLILSASDDLADTIRPRLDACGADPARVFVLPSITDLRNDFGQLEAAIDRAPDCRLIIVDPVNAFVGPSDSHFHTIVRRVLTPLMRLAKEKRIAVLAVTQFRKADGPAIRSAAGSMGLVTTAQSLWTVCRDPREAGRMLLLPIKQNLVAAPTGLAFRIDEQPATRAPHIAWLPEVVPLSPDEAFKKPPKPPSLSPERLAAREWLQEILAAGPRPARSIFDEGKIRGFLPRTLQRAFQELEGHTAKQGMVAGWWWSLSGQTQADKPGATPKTPDAFEGVTYEQDIADHQETDNLIQQRDLEFAAVMRGLRREIAEEQPSCSQSRPAPVAPPPTNPDSQDATGRAPRVRPPTPPIGNPTPAPSSRNKLSPDDDTSPDRLKWSQPAPGAHRRRAVIGDVRTNRNPPANEPIPIPPSPKCREPVT